MESSIRQSCDSSPPLSAPLNPRMYRSPCFSSCFSILPPICVPSSCLQMCTGFFSSKINQNKTKNQPFFLTLKPPHKTVLFISFIFFQISQTCGLPHILHFLTADSLLPHLRAAFHQYPFTENVFPRSPVAFLPPPPT